MLDDLAAGVSSPIAWPLVLLRLAIGVVLSLALRAHYVHFGATIANRRKLAMEFPLLTMTTALIITIVKSSLALSLGLVGALSIVRFRTPVKEPEELIHLFLAVAIGLGVGAGHEVTTMLGTGVILATM